MVRVKLTVAYVGTRYVGWQFQHNGLSVQEVLERALASITGQSVRVHGSGRTDSGVHAWAQVAHFDAPDHRVGIPWRKALNSKLPEDVSILDAEEVADDFHSRYSAKSKSYLYTFWIEPGYILPQRRHFVWSCGEVNLSAMEEAACLFEGEHDFAAFQNSGAAVKSTVRNVTSVCILPGERDEERVLRVEAKGFLKQMVRNMAGCLVAIGRGKAEPSFVTTLLACGDRTQAPPTAPARGLSLERVLYDT